MKIRQIFTVTREYSIKDNELEDEIFCFEGIKDEAGEHLYGGGDGDEEITVILQTKKKNDWITILGEATTELAKR